MIETLLFFVAVLTASIVVMWCERNRLERQNACLQNELAEAKADAIKSVEEFTVKTELRNCTSFGEWLRESYYLLLKNTVSLHQSRRKIIEHCRLLKRSQKDLRHLTDYILDELTTINTSR